MKSHARFHVQRAWKEFVIVKRADEVLCIEARCFDCLLWIHAKLDYVQEHLKERLILIITARSAEYHKRFATLQDERGRQCDSRSFTWGDYIWTVRIGQRGLQTLAHQDSSIAGDHGRQPRPTWSCAKKIPIFVNHVHASRVVRSFEH